MENAVKTFNQVFSCSFLHPINQQLPGGTVRALVLRSQGELCCPSDSSNSWVCKICKLLNVQSRVGKECKKKIGNLAENPSALSSEPKYNSSGMGMSVCLTLFCIKRFFGI